MSVWFL